MWRDFGRAQTMTYGAAIFVSVGLSVWFFGAGMWNRNLYILLGLAAFLFPRVLARFFDVRLTVPLECFGVAVIFGSCVLGEALGAYEAVVFWDDLMHLLSGILFCAFGFSVWEIADGGRRALAGVAFATTAGVMWEFIEYFCDLVLHTDMQKDVILTDVSSHFFTEGDAVGRFKNASESTIGGISFPGVLDIGLHDTMNDLLMALVGALVFLILYRIDLLYDTRLSRPFIPHRHYELWDGKR